MALFANKSFEVQKSARNSEVEALKFNSCGVDLTNIQTLTNEGMQAMKIKHATFKAAYMVKEDNQVVKLD